MEIIPVIDIRHNQVVHAIEGKRKSYQPLKTSLSNSNHPQDIVQAFINYYPFETIYIADLNAIDKQGDNEQSIESLTQSFQSLNFWVDQNISSAKKICSPSIRQHIIGSETNISANELAKIVSLTPNVILSLDFRDKLFQGHTSVLEDIAIWPNRIIIMSMSHVGSNRGPDYSLIRYLKHLANEKQLYVAGGVRHEADLQTLFDIGISGVLVATTLHNQQLLPKNLRQLHKQVSIKKSPHFDGDFCTR